MSVRDKNELVSGFCIGAFGIYVVVEASRLAYFSEYGGPGPGFLPLWLGIGLSFLGLLLSSLNLSGPARDKSSDARPWLGAGRALGGWAGLVGAIAFLPLLGFTLSFGLLTGYLLRVVDRRSLWATFTVALGLMLGFHLVFAFALGVPLPAGPFGF
jgi:putative tricarboxylic transport membrane protein